MAGSEHRAYMKWEREKQPDQRDVVDAIRRLKVARDVLRRALESSMAEGQEDLNKIVEARDGAERELKQYKAQFERNKAEVNSEHNRLGREGDALKSVGIDSTAIDERINYINRMRSEIEIGIRAVTDALQ